MYAIRSYYDGINLPYGKVGHVVYNSPAYDAGIRAGDEIIEVNGDRNNFV